MCMMRRGRVWVSLYCVESEAEKRGWARSVVVLLLTDMRNLRWMNFTLKLLSVHYLLSMFPRLHSTTFPFANLLFPKRACELWVSGSIARVWLHNKQST